MNYSFTNNHRPADLMDPLFDQYMKDAQDHISRRFDEVTETVFMSAIIKECGNMPRFDTIRRHATLVVTPDFIRHLIWKGKEIASVKPPFYHDTHIPHHPYPR